MTNDKMLLILAEKLYTDVPTLTDALIRYAKENNTGGSVASTARLCHMNQHVRTTVGFML